MMPAAQVLCLLRLALCAGGLAPTVVFADTGAVAAVYQPVRPVRLVPPADLPPDPASLSPGLDVRTAEVWMERQVFPRRPAAAAGGWSGQLVLPTGVAAGEIFGFIRFAQPGLYRLRLAASAPLRLSVASLEIYESGGPPAGGLSPALPFQVTAAGWYPLTIGVASADQVRLDWQTPDDPGAWVMVPEAMLAH